MGTYDIGDRIKLTGTFTNASANDDPDTVTVYWKDPSANTTSTTAVTNDSTGVYSYQLDIDEAGTWSYRFDGVKSDTTYQGAGENSFKVRESGFV